MKRTKNPNLEPDAEMLAYMETEKAKYREEKEQAEKAKPVEIKSVATGRMDGISNRARGLHE